MRNEVFHYTPPSPDYDVPEIIISISALRMAAVQAIAEGGDIMAAMIAIDPGLLEAVNREERDESRIAFYMDPANADACDLVCFLLRFPDGSHLLADGNHRVIARHRLGHDNFRAALLGESVWKKAIVAMMPSKAEHLSFV